MYTRTVGRRLGAKRTKGWLVVMLLLGVALAGVGCAPSGTSPGESGAEAGSKGFARFGLETDTSKRLVELDEFLSGGPPKDGIPVLTAPKYEPIAESSIPDDVRGVLVEIGDDARFFPYNVMVWHEIVNDVVGGKPVAVTF